MCYHDQRSPFQHLLDRAGGLVPAGASTPPYGWFGLPGFRMDRIDRLMAANNRRRAYGCSGSRFLDRIRWLREFDRAAPSANGIPDDQMKIGLTSLAKASHEILRKNA